MVDIDRFIVGREKLGIRGSGLLIEGRIDGLVGVLSNYPAFREIMKLII